jgi:ribosomal protein L11 methyltransferase
MAFGTGDHATTRGVLALMQQAVRTGDVIADLGSGSGVLAIAAAKLGARRVFAVELDPDAIGNAELNVRCNGVEESVAILEGEASVLLPLLSPVQGVLANIVSSVILELLPRIGDSLTTGGFAIFSGMLTSEREIMRAAFDEAGWRETDNVSEDEWWSVLLRRA